MTKKTIFTLLLTTVISSGAVLAMEEGLFSPPTGRKLATLPKTPQIEEEARAKFPTSVYTPDSAAFQASLHVDRKKQERDMERDRVIAESSRRALDKKIGEQRQAVQEENQRQIEALTAKMSALHKTLEGQKVSKGEAEKEAERLASRIAVLEAEKDEMSRKIALERTALEAQIARDKEELERQRAQEDLILREKVELEAQIERDKEELAKQVALGKEIESAKREIESAKNDLAQQSLLEKTELLRQIEAERAKKRAAMDASREALDQMRGRLSEITRQSAQLATERDELVLKTELLQTTEEGLRRQIALVHSRLDATTTLADSDSEDDSGDGKRGVVLSTPAPAPATLGGSLPGGHSSTASGAKALPKSNLAGRK